MRRTIRAISIRPITGIFAACVAFAASADPTVEADPVAGTEKSATVIEEHDFADAPAERTVRRYDPRRYNPATDSWDVEVSTEFTSRGSQRYGINVNGSISDRVRVWLNYSDGATAGLGNGLYRLDQGTSMGAGFEYRSERSVLHMGIQRGPMGFGCGRNPSLDTYRGSAINDYVQAIECAAGGFPGDPTRNYGYGNPYPSGKQDLGFYLD